MGKENRSPDVCLSWVLSLTAPLIWLNHFLIVFNRTELHSAQKWSLSHTPRKPSAGGGSGSTGPGNPHPSVLSAANSGTLGLGSNWNKEPTLVSQVGKECSRRALRARAGDHIRNPSAEQSCIPWVPPCELLAWLPLEAGHGGHFFVWCGCMTGGHPGCTGGWQVTLSCSYSRSADSSPQQKRACAVSYLLWVRGRVLEKRHRCVTLTKTSCGQCWLWECT